MVRSGVKHSSIWCMRSSLVTVRVASEEVVKYAAKQYWLLILYMITSSPFVSPVSNFLQTCVQQKLPADPDLMLSELAISVQSSVPLTLRLVSRKGAAAQRLQRSMNDPVEGTNPNMSLSTLSLAKERPPHMRKSVLLRWQLMRATQYKDQSPRETAPTKSKLTILLLTQHSACRCMNRLSETSPQVQQNELTQLRLTDTPQKSKLPEDTTSNTESAFPMKENFYPFTSPLMLRVTESQELPKTLMVGSKDTRSDFVVKSELSFHFEKDAVTTLFC